MNDKFQRTQLLLRRGRAGSETMRYHRTRGAPLVSGSYFAWREPSAAAAHAWDPSMERIAK
jgi:hypothetical protein